MVLTLAASGGEQTQRSDGRGVSGVWAWRRARVAVPRRESCPHGPQMVQRQSAVRESQRLPELRTRRWAGGGHRCGRVRGQLCQLQGCPGGRPGPARPGPAGLPTSVPGAQPPPSFGVAATEARRPGTMCQTGKQEMCSSRKPQFWKIKTKIFFSKIIIEKNTLQ